MRQCVIWGSGNEYESMLNQIKYEELKGNLKCNAVLSKTRSRFAKKIDGYDIISKDGLRDITFDYLIVTAAEAFAEIQAEAREMGIPENRIIPGRVLNLPNFDFKRYVSLLENPVTILSDNCWGAMTYHTLGLPFTSPLINTYCPQASYCKFIQDPFFYLEQPLRVKQEGIPRQNVFPIGQLGEGDKSVEVQFMHEASFERAEKRWNERKKRINKSRVFVKSAIDGDDPRREEYLAVFAQIPYNKMCLYSGETNIKDVVYMKRFEWDWYNGPLEVAFAWNKFGSWFMHNTTTSVDLLKLLNGEKDYIREE